MKTTHAAPYHANERRAEGAHEARRCGGAPREGDKAAKSKQNNREDATPLDNSLHRASLRAFSIK